MQRLPNIGEITHFERIYFHIDVDADRTGDQTAG